MWCRRFERPLHDRCRRPPLEPACPIPLRVRRNPAVRHLRLIADVLERDPRVATARDRIASARRDLVRQRSDQPARWQRSLWCYPLVESIVPASRRAMRSQSMSSSVNAFRDRSNGHSRGGCPTMRNADSPNKRSARPTRSGSDSSRVRQHASRSTCRPLRQPRDPVRILPKRAGENANPPPALGWAPAARYGWSGSRPRSPSRSGSTPSTSASGIRVPGVPLHRSRRSPHVQRDSGHPGLPQQPEHLRVRERRHVVDQVASDLEGAPRDGGSRRIH